MNRLEKDRPDVSGVADERFWQAFAQAAGFEDELRDLIASEGVDAVDAELNALIADEDLTADDYLAADRLHELLLAARPAAVEPATVELAPQRSAEKVDREPRRQMPWLAVLSVFTLGTAAAVAAIVWLGDDETQAGGANAEVASAERLAEAWVAVREEAGPRDVALLNDIDADLEPEIDSFGFDETPDWLVLAMERQAGLDADAVQEATP
jgi:hypothetical protein